MTVTPEMNIKPYNAILELSV